MTDLCLLLAQIQNKETSIVDMAQRTSHGTLQWFLEKDRAIHGIHNHNHLQFLVCGEEGFSAIGRDIGAATETIDLVLWGFDPGMELRRANAVGDDGPGWPRGATYGDLLSLKAREGVKVRLLLWYSDVLINHIGGNVAEADVNPPVTVEAEALFRQGMAATSHDLWISERDYSNAAKLWEQAMRQGHWKAQFNLAGLFLKGLGVEQDIERAIQLTEDLMRKGVPAAWDNMGAYYMGGVGPLKQDASVAYAFWQRAADMGSMTAQAYLGRKLLGTYDDPPLFWANRAVSRKMLECAVPQGSSDAAYTLGLDLIGDDVALGEDMSRALSTLHEGVRLGSQSAANSLFVAFEDGKPVVRSLIDPARAERYFVLADALGRNPDLRFPNLDKVLALPPAQLPKWDGNKQTLIDAAKGVVPAPVVKPSPAAQRTGRAHIPEGWYLPTNPVALRDEVTDGVRLMPQYEGTAARFTGYYWPQLLESTEPHHTVWNRSQVPLRYALGEGFEAHRAGLGPRDGRIMWHYLGVAVQRPPTEPHPLIVQGVARYARVPQPALRCPGDRPCPETGIWHGHISRDHAMAGAFNRWDRQVYLAQGAAFPDPKAMQLDLARGDVTWSWMGQANRVATSGFAGVTVGAS